MSFSSFQLKLQWCYKDKSSTIRLASSRATLWCQPKDFLTATGLFIFPHALSLLNLTAQIRPVVFPLWEIEEIHFLGKWCNRKKTGTTGILETRGVQKYYLYFCSIAGSSDSTLWLWLERWRSLQPVIKTHYKRKSSTTALVRLPVSQWCSSHCSKRSIRRVDL